MECALCHAPNEDGALLPAVARWTFEPASRGGRPIEATLLKELRF
jgi:hypothetical protein